MVSLRKREERTKYTHTTSASSKVGFDEDERTEEIRFVMLSLLWVFCVYSSSYHLRVRILYTSLSAFVLPRSSPFFSALLLLLLWKPGGSARAQKLCHDVERADALGIHVRHRRHVRRKIRVVAAIRLGVPVHRLQRVRCRWCAQRGRRHGRGDRERGHEIAVRGRAQLLLRMRVVPVEGGRRAI